MRRVVQLRIALARRPWLVWLAAGAAAGFVALALHGQFAAADAARREWGEAVEVVVATDAVDPGSPATSADLARRRVPRALVPDGALRAVPQSGVVVRRLARGEILVDADVGSGDDRFSLVPAGHSVVALPRPTVLPPLAPGDAVQLAGGTPDGTLVHVTARVLSVVDAAILVAVASDDAADVALAAADQVRPPAIVLVPPPG
jgi:hypothetical protein